MSTALSVCHGKFGRAAIYRLDKSLITHAHREGHLIFHVDGGLCDIEVNDTSFTVDLQLAAAVNPLESHSFNLNTSENCVTLVVYLSPTCSLGDRGEGELPLRFGCSQIKRTEEINDVLSRFVSYLLEPKAIDKFDPLLFGLSKLCYQQSWVNMDATKSDTSTAPRGSDARINRALLTMHDCISADVELEAVARAVGLSRPHFFKLFKRQMGITPYVYMNTLRSEHAIHDLIHTDKTVTDIARELGYSSQASFSRFFSTNVGVAPSEYRKIQSSA